MWQDVSKSTFGSKDQKIKIAKLLLSRPDTQPEVEQVPDLVSGACKAKFLDLAILLAIKFKDQFESIDTLHPKPIWAGADSGDVEIVKSILKTFGENQSTQNYYNH